MFFRKQDNEQTLLQSIQQGDAKAMRTLYSQHIGYLTAVCSRYIADNEDVKDVLQESFLRIFSHIDQFTPHQEGSLRAWMTRIVVNESLNFLKKDQPFTMVEYTDELLNVPDESPETDDIPTTVIEQFIRELPTGYRTVFNLYVFEQKTHREIATILHIKEDTSASQLHRAKQILVQKINEYKTKRDARGMV